MMRILILGATGMLGHQACRVLSGSREVHAVSRGTDNLLISQPAFFKNCILHDKFDALDSERLSALISHLRPDVVLNCIGVVKQREDNQNPAESIKVNSLLPHLVAQACSEIGSKLIQVSTDCVFSGNKGNYTECDLPDPADLYGRTKLLGEVSFAPHMTIRTSFIGRQLRDRNGLLEWFLSHEDNRVSGYTRAVFSGLTSLALCQLVENILGQAFDLTGTYHIAGESISKYELLSLVNKRLSLGRVIEPDDSLICDRSLDGLNFRRATGLSVPSYDVMIEQLAEDNPNYE